MKKKIDIRALGLGLLITLLLFSCNKEEFMPPAVGEAIKLEDEITDNFPEALAKSAHTLFYEAWKRSGMNDFMIYKGYPENGFTVLVPTDEAMLAKGWNSQVIAAATSGTLDTLILRHTFIGAISEVDLSLRPDSYVAINILESRDYYYFEGKPNTISGIYLTTGREVWPYRHRLYLHRTGNELYANGNKVGNQSPFFARNGSFWPVDTVLEYPTKTAIEVLREDPQFSIYVDLMDRMEQGKLNLINTVVTPIISPSLTFDSPLFTNYVQRLGLGIWPAHPYTNALFTQGKPVISTLASWFIPTNKAFQDAGFQTADEVWALNDRNAAPTITRVSGSIVNVQYTFYYKKLYATDTLLNYHHDWGRLYAPKNTTTYRTGISNITAFYSQDLDNAILGDYMLNGLYNERTNSNTNEDKRLFYYMPFEFRRDGDQVSLRIKNSGAAYVPITGKDIATLNGPIHAVDKLIIPPGFSLDK
ncbi:hypothetical protein [Sphingobacterium sp. LRF_L2]|uniref:hypothetical protein n=1 Tax=Sphingobacterium sp. LRF_L2 TaxID=3369421 RepID=UPI003F630AA4